jgi:hypothetical protein
VAGDVGRGRAVKALRLQLVPGEPKPEPRAVEEQAHRPPAGPRAPLEAPKHRRRVAIALAAAAASPLAPRLPRRAPRLARVGVIVTPPALPARPRRRRLHFPASASPAFRSLRFARNSAAASPRSDSASASASASALETNSRRTRRADFLVRSVPGTLASLREAAHSAPLSRSRTASTRDDNGASSTSNDSPKRLRTMSPANVKQYTCSISQEPMVDPVLAEDGNTYYRGGGNRAVAPDQHHEPPRPKLHLDHCGPPSDSGCARGHGDLC